MYVWKKSFSLPICLFFSNFQAANTFQERFLSILSPGQWILFARGHLDKFSDPTILFSVSNSAVSSLNYLTREVLSMKNLLAQKTILLSILPQHQYLRSSKVTVAFAHPVRKHFNKTLAHCKDAIRSRQNDLTELKSFVKVLFLTLYWHYPTYLSNFYEKRWREIGAYHYLLWRQRHIFNRYSHLSLISLTPSTFFIFISSSFYRGSWVLFNRRNIETISSYSWHWVGW